MRLRFAFGALGAALSGCLFPSVDLLSTPSAQLDAGVDATSDTSNDASADAGPDASPAFDCVGAAFCATFDQSTDVASLWTGRFQSPGATLVRDTTRARSAPAGFLSTTPPGAKNEYLAAALYKDIPRGSATVLRWRFSARVVKLDPTDHVTVADLLHFTDVDNWSSARVWLKDGVFDVEEEASTGGSVTVNAHHEVPHAWPMDQWMQLDLAVDIVKRQATLSHDGAVVVSFGLTTAWAGPDLQATVGVFYSSGTQTGHQIAYDDVRLDLVP